MYTTQLLSLALSFAAAEAAYQGFNYGSTQTDGTAKAYEDFKDEFTTAQNLVGTSGFTSARLYTMVQGGTTDTVISALQAAIDTDTSLLLGMWASGDTFSNELTALKTAITQYPSLASSIVGLAVGSEDLYRNSATGIENESGIGANPDTIVSYIKEVRSAIADTKWSGIPIGHVDTWDAWSNSTNAEVIDNLDWLGVDEYPYFQYTQSNAIDSAANLFADALSVTKSVAGGRPVWITETGWPVSGPKEGSAVASTANAKTYWEQVGCPLFGETNVWWYTLQDAYPTTPSPSFGIVGTTLSTTPLYDLSCANATNTTLSVTSSVLTASGTSTATAASASGSGSSTSSSSSDSPYGNGTSTSSGASATGTGSSDSSSDSSSSSGSSSSSDSSASAGSSSGSSTATGSSASATSSSSSSYTGAASTLGSSAIGIFGAVAAAVLLL